MISIQYRITSNDDFIKYFVVKNSATRENLIRRGIALVLAKTKRYCYLAVARVNKGCYSYGGSSSVFPRKSATTIIPTVLPVG